MPGGRLFRIIPLVGFVGLLSIIAGCSAAPTRTPTPPPAAGVVLQKILNDCWGVTTIKDLDGSREDHVKAFECARKRLLQMAEVYPEAAEPHRVLAWGYLYCLKDESVAQAEYERAEQIYQQQGRSTDQAEMLVRIAVQLTMPHDQRRGCSLLAEASTVDPQNERIAVLQQNFNCVPRGTSQAASPLSTPALNPEPVPTTTTP